jgi:hypothetical protein
VDAARAVTGYSWAWVVWFAAFLAIEIPAAITNDRIGHPQSLSMNIWWLIRGKGIWHHTARLTLLLFLAWLVTHLLSGGWV